MGEAEAWFLRLRRPRLCLPSLGARGLWRPGLRFGFGRYVAADAWRHCGATSVPGEGKISRGASGHFECTPPGCEFLRIGWA